MPGQEVSRPQRLRLYSESFLDIPLLFPPLPEQAAIVRYLDYVDRRIRRYVSAKRKLIALLEEEKQAIVNRAVTRGLDPNVRLKPSGVEWLGDVPEHWDVSRVWDRVPKSLHGYRTCHVAMPPTGPTEAWLTVQCQPSTTTTAHQVRLGATECHLPLSLRPGSVNCWVTEAWQDQRNVRCTHIGYNQPTFWVSTMQKKHRFEAH